MEKITAKDAKNISETSGYIKNLQDVYDKIKICSSAGMRSCFSNIILRKEDIEELTGAGFTVDKPFLGMQQIKW